MLLDKVFGELPAKADLTPVAAFQLAPEATVHVVGDGARCAWSHSGLDVEVTGPAGLAATVTDGYFSPSYGVRVAAPALRLTKRADVDTERTFAFRVATATPSCPSVRSSQA